VPVTGRALIAFTPATGVPNHFVQVACHQLLGTLLATPRQRRRRPLPALRGKPTGFPAPKANDVRALRATNTSCRVKVDLWCRCRVVLVLTILSVENNFAAMKILDIPRSGSVAGTTSSRNRNGQYVRTRAIPVNVNSVAQLAVRSRLATNSAAWRALTAAQRAGWESLGLMITRTDSLGQTYDLTGFQAYNSVNNNRVAAGDAVVSDAPAVSTPAGLLTATITLTAAAMSVAYTTTPLAAGNRLFSFVSPQRSAGRSFEGDFRLIAVSAAAAASPANIKAAYDARLGVPVVGNRIFFSLQTYAAGFLSIPFPVSQVVA